MFKKITNKLTALLLCLVTAIGCSVIVISTPKTVRVSAESWEGYDYDLEEINSYLENQDISDGEIEDEQERIHSKYEDYIQFDGTYLNYEELPYYSRQPELFLPLYNDDISEDSIEYRNYLYSMLDEEGVQCVFEEYHIIRNINFMNEVVSDEEGYIDGDELILYDLDAENYARWRAWNFKLKWYMFSVNFDADFAIVFSIALLAADILLVGFNINDITNSIKDGKIEDLLMQAFFYIPNNLAAQLVALKSNEAISYLITIVPDIVDVLTSGKKFWKKIFRIIAEKALPSVEDCLITLFYGLIENRGCYFQFCWFPYNTKWGVKIQPL